VKVGAWDTRIFSHVFTPPVIDDGKLYYGLTISHELGRSINCLDAATGEEIWKKEIGETESGFLKSMGPNITVRGGNLFCIISDSVFCLDGKTGKVKWEYPLPEWAGGKAPMALHGSTLFLREINTVIALNTEDGTWLWETPVPGMDTMPAFSDGKVVVGSNDYHIYILDGITGLSNRVRMSYPQMN
jgi:outer membrane protein assembly factor BamB